MADLRNVNRSRVHEDMVQQLAMTNHEETGRSIFPTIRELICFAAMLGYSEGRRMPLDRNKGLEDISYQQFERNDSQDLIYMIALAETKSADLLRDDSKEDFVSIFEEYANGGLEIISEWMRENNDAVGDRAISSGLQKNGYLSGDIDKDIDEVIAATKF